MGKGEAALAPASFKRQGPCSGVFLSALAAAELLSRAASALTSLPAVPALFALGAFLLGCNCVSRYLLYIAVSPLYSQMYRYSHFI